MLVILTALQDDFSRCNVSIHVQLNENNVDLQSTLDSIALQTGITYEIFIQTGYSPAQVDKYNELLAVMKEYQHIKHNNLLSNAGEYMLKYASIATQQCSYFLLMRAGEVFDEPYSLKQAVTLADERGAEVTVFQKYFTPMNATQKIFDMVYNFPQNTSVYKILHGIWFWQRTGQGMTFSGKLIKQPLMVKVLNYIQQNIIREVATQYLYYKDELLFMTLTYIFAETHTTDFDINFTVSRRNEPVITNPLQALQLTANTTFVIAVCKQVLMKLKDEFDMEQSIYQYYQIVKDVLNQTITVVNENEYKTICKYFIKNKILTADYNHELVLICKLTPEDLKEISE
ncbi:Hypothetical_protein [Hexamita inflata]|uniref:Hypothetical_protein n=1 Tax=Hexamita inflata TaxID=28002 RepID=A0AA86R7Q4_9EUKA|nr:Hypothetical protein HINF_LOCUS59810 [Hexamita inflata]